MKFISWNVNGLRACVQKGFLDFFREADADIFCVQETKLQEGQIDLGDARVSSVLELRGEKGIFRDGSVHEEGAVKRLSWHRAGRA